MASRDEWIRLLAETSLSVGKLAQSMPTTRASNLPKMLCIALHRYEAIDEAFQVRLLHAEHSGRWKGSQHPCEALDFFR